MFIGIQILVIIFLIFMMYLTYLNYKRKNYGSKSLISWLILWVAALFVIIFPKILQRTTFALNLTRITDLLFVTGFMIFSIILFKIYVDVKKTKEQTEKLVREMAIQNPKKNKK